LIFDVEFEIIFIFQYFQRVKAYTRSPIDYNLVFQIKVKQQWNY